jgi:ABC-type polysaccharide/polyol phosphate transport system ATPase subunit
VFNSGIASLSARRLGRDWEQGSVWSSPEWVGNAQAPQPSLGVIYGEETIIGRLEQGASVEAIFDEYVEGSLDFGLRERFEDCMAEMERREQSTAIALSGHIRRNYRRKRQFLIFNHPTTDLLVELCDQLRALTGLPIDLPALRRIDDENAAKLPGERVNSPISPHDASILGYEFGYDFDWVERGGGLIPESPPATPETANGTSEYCSYDLRLIVSLPNAIEVRDLSKTFRIPTNQVKTLRDRLVQRTRPTFREVPVLDGISFDVPRGQFLGIAGRNGSGKSTLLKILAGIYRADSGTAFAGGRTAPIIELGVGFNNELPAYENVLMNAVMMGLSPADARRRYREIIEFAELSDFEHLKLRNYSSGMRARLGFAVMTHVDADILLFDEVLAVGDGRFREKCSETFERLRGDGRTGVLVTHSMGELVKQCESALLLEDGEIAAEGSPEHVAEEYTRLQARAPKAAA